jgi:lysosomal-associated membrane protein 1/2
MYTNNKNESASRSYDVPANQTTLDGSCGSNNTAPESMTISFFEDVWKLALDFTLMEDKKEWAITKIALTFDTTDFGDYDNSTYTVSLNQPLFQTPNASSYQCVTQDTISLTDVPAGAPTVVNITTNELRIQAFRMQGPGSFSTAVPCPADTNVSNIVPIAVGAALAALVVIVLIAYLIGRKKNKRGYESV